MLLDWIRDLHLPFVHMNLKGWSAQICAAEIVLGNVVVRHKVLPALLGRLSLRSQDQLLQFEIVPRFVWHNAVQTHALHADLKSGFHA